MSGAFDTLAGRIVDRLSAGLAEATRADSIPDDPPQLMMNPPDVKPQRMAELDVALMNAANGLIIDTSLVPGLDGTWDTWLNNSLVPIESQGIADMGDVDMDMLLATIGGSPDWLNAMVARPDTQKLAYPVLFEG